ncbi:hypothetical protein ACFQL7_20595 [Halocatena marina]|uniref:Uncharacterized protein n=1 Tax=Halocatena marina TaxID=2934937 RepID=A0ABD5YU88_9EURY
MNMDSSIAQINIKLTTMTNQKWTVTDSRKLANKMINKHIEIDDHHATTDAIAFKFTLDFVNRTLTKDMWKFNFRVQETGKDYIRFIKVQDLEASSFFTIETNEVDQ